MSNKKIVASVIVALLVAFIVYATFVQRVHKESVTIPYTLGKINEQLNIPLNIANWYVPFSGARERTVFDTSQLKMITGDYSLQLTKSQIVGASYLAAKKDQARRFYFGVTPDTAGYSKVQLTYSTTLLKDWLGAGELEKNAKTSLEQLKQYMEDTKRLYGFEIQSETVTDTAFLFKSSIVPVSERTEGMKKLFDELIAFADANNAGFNGVKIFYSQTRTNNELELYAGIGVTNKVITQPNASIQYKLMPGGKNLLSAFYQGPYGKVGDAYQALQDFKSDHGLISMAIPFEKFLGNEYSFTDSQMVQLKVYYPIF